jgi:dTDP-glucose 4,6-dehydratase
VRILVTGGAGFIGSNFVKYILGHYPRYEIVVLDCFTYAGHRSNLVSIMDRITLSTSDICYESDVNKAMADIDTVVHFAAESHVDRSIVDPELFLKTNILGTNILLRSALNNNVKRFHHISTDEVFGTLPLDDSSFNESSPYSPRSPYAASKASSDHLVRAYGDTYGLSYTITNCSNNYGPYQTPEKVIPLFISKALDGKKLPIYGDGLCVRDYLYVTDHCRAIDLVLHYGSPGETFCIGGGEEKNGIQLAIAILNILNLPTDNFEFVGDRPGHDRRYAIDSSYIREKLGWEPSISFDEALDETVAWYTNNQDWWRPIQEHTRILKW